MSNLWNLVGRVTYYLTFPLIALAIRFTSRTRLIVEFNGKILVVKGWLGDNKWFLPGGGLQRKEDPKHGAKRELLEETGVDISEKNINLISEGIYNKGITKYKYYLYHVTLNKIPKTKKQQFEIIDISWLDPKEINKGNSSRELINLLELWK